MAEQETASPLQWPTGWPRVKHRERARFRGTSLHAYTARDANGVSVCRQRSVSRELTIAEAIDRLQSELERLGGRYPVLSTNLELRRDGSPRSGQREPQDPGAAVYFTLKARRVVLACDKWDRAADNIAAIAAHIAAMRGQERWGVGSLEQAFAGYAKLPSPQAARSWRTVLGLGDGEITRERAESRYRELALRHHPDVSGGSHEQMAELTQAIVRARAELAGS